MAFRDNSLLIRTAAEVEVEANASDDPFSGAFGATAFVVAAGDVGDDTFLNFGTDDSLITSSAIFDGNSDGFIAFGPNGVLDVNRTGRGDANAGMDQFQLAGNNGDIFEIRYLGEKGGSYVYADSTTLRTLFSEFGQSNVLEGDVGDDTINMSGGAKVLLHDNALGLNLGGDRIENFGSDDLLYTTSEIFDRDGNGIITFWDNEVLDTSGADGPSDSDPEMGPGGQLDFVGLDSISYLGMQTLNGITYYVYGTEDTTVNPID